MLMLGIGIGMVVVYLFYGALLLYESKKPPEQLPKISADDFSDPEVETKFWKISKN
jgi:hypothetical protein